MHTRRQLLKLTLFSSLAASVLILAGCSQVQPEPVPFKTGREVTPRIGCTELRANDSLGDCGFLASERVTAGGR